MDLIEPLIRHGWTLSVEERDMIHDVSGKDLPPVLFSVRKTFLEGIDVIRFLHGAGSNYIIISSVESHCSGPATAVEATFSDITQAREWLVRQCLEDDDYYR